MTKKKRIFNGTFFNFLFGFIFIIAISLGVILSTSYYETSNKYVAQAATAILSITQGK